MTQPNKALYYGLAKDDIDKLYVVSSDEAVFHTSLRDLKNYIETHGNVNITHYTMIDPEMIKDFYNTDIKYAYAYNTNQGKYNKLTEEVFDDDNTIIICKKLVIELHTIKEIIEEIGKMKVFISQPMNGKSKEEILSEREEIIKNIKNLYQNREIEIINSVLDDEDVLHNKPLYNLGQSLKLLSEADMIFMCDEWYKYRGCRIEHLAACEYGIKVKDGSM